MRHGAILRRRGGMAVAHRIRTWWDSAGSSLPLPTRSVIRFSTTATRSTRPRGGHPPVLHALPFPSCCCCFHSTWIRPKQLQPDRPFWFPSQHSPPRDTTVGTEPTVSRSSASSAPPSPPLSTSSLSWLPTTSGLSSRSEHGSYILQVKGTTRHHYAAAVGIVLLQRPPQTQQQEPSQVVHTRNPSPPPEEPVVVFAGRYFLPRWRSAFEIEYTAICMGLDLAHQYLLPQQQPLEQQQEPQQEPRRPIVLELQLDHAVIRQQLQGTLPISKTNHQERLTFLYWQIMAQSQAFVFDIQPISPVQNRQAVHLAWTAFVTGQSASVSLPTSTSRGSSSSSLSSSIWAIQQRPSQRFVVRQPLQGRSHPNPHPCDLELAFVPLEDPYNRLKKHNEEEEEDDEQEENVQHEEEYPELLDHSLEPPATEQDRNHAGSPGNQDPDAPCSSSSASSVPPPSAMVPPRVARPYNERNIMRMMSPMDPTQTYLLQCDGGCRGRPTFVSGVGMVLYQLNHQDDDDNKKNHHQDSWHQKPEMENEWNTHLVEVWCGFKCFLPSSATLQTFSSSRHRRNRQAKNETNNHKQNSSPVQNNNDDHQYDEGLRNEAGRMSNNVAEIWSLLLGLEQARRLGIRNLRVQMDCDTVVRIIYQATTTTNKASSPVPTTDNSNDDDSLSLSSSLSVNALPLGPFIRQVQELVETHFDEFEIEHIRRQYNRRADFLANHAMDFQCDYGVDPDIVISGSSPQHASIPKNQQTEPEDTLPYMYKEECDSEDNDDDVNELHLSSMADQHS